MKVGGVGASQGLSFCRFIWLDTCPCLKQKGIHVPKLRAPAMSKEAMREESKRLVEEAMARNVPITRGKTQMEVKCNKCSAPNRVNGGSRAEPRAVYLQALWSQTNDLVMR